MPGNLWQNTARQPFLLSTAGRPNGKQALARSSSDFPITKHWDRRHQAITYDISYYCTPRVPPAGVSPSQDEPLPPRSSHHTSLPPSDKARCSGEFGNLLVKRSRCGAYHNPLYLLSSTQLQGGTGQIGPGSKREGCWEGIHICSLLHCQVSISHTS